MLRLDAALRRRRKLFIGLWAVALVAALPFAARQAEHLTGGGWEAAGSESIDVNQRVERDFPGVRSASLVAVVVPRDDAKAGDLTNALATVERKIATVDELEVAPAARERARTSARTRPGRPVLIPLPVSGGQTAAIDVAKDLREALGIEHDAPATAAEGRVAVHVAGLGGLWAAFQAVSEVDTRTAEARGFPVIAIVLLLAFGSLAAAALPLGLGFAAVLITGAIIYFVSLSYEMSIFVTSMASMIGIGVAVDYSLFVLARYREEVAAGRAPEEARGVALATSGVAVIFSGLTVIASLAALFLIDSTAIRSMALGPIIVVAMSMLAASTLLPLLISVLGRRAYEPGRIGRLLARRRRDRDFWARWARAVMARPLLAVVVASGLLLGLAYPALDLKVENSASAQLPNDSEALAGTRAAASVIGPGTLGPTLVLVDLARGSVRDGENQAVLRRVRETIAADPAVRRVGAARTSEDRRQAQLTVLLKPDPESEAAHDAVARLRDRLPEVVGGDGSAKVGGTTAAFGDFDDLVASSLWKIILVVFALSFVVLVVLLRSIVLPLKAVVMNILSVSAAYGVLVMAFQYGWLEWIGLDKTGSVNTITPPLVLVVCFGLSMDYEVFLLSRIRERYTATGDTGRAVAEALASSAHTISSAALIMVAVFIAFVSAGLPNLQQIGLASAVAIAVDATIVRLLLVPAAMKLLGERNWWLPRPLARILPRADVETLRPVEERLAVAAQ